MDILTIFRYFDGLACFAAEPKLHATIQLSNFGDTCVSLAKNCMRPLTQ